MWKVKQHLVEEGPLQPCTVDTGCFPALLLPALCPGLRSRSSRATSTAKIFLQVSEVPSRKTSQTWHWDAQCCGCPHFSLRTQSQRQLDTAPSSHCLQPFNTASLTSGLWRRTTSGSGSEKQQVVFSNVSSGCSLLPGHHCQT